MYDVYKCITRIKREIRSKTWVLHTAPVQLYSYKDLLKIYEATARLGSSESSILCIRLNNSPPLNRHNISDVRAAYVIMSVGTPRNLYSTQLRTIVMRYRSAIYRALFIDKIFHK